MFAWPDINNPKNQTWISFERNQTIFKYCLQILQFATHTHTHILQNYNTTVYSYTYFYLKMHLYWFCTHNVLWITNFPWPRTPRYYQYICVRRTVEFWNSREGQIIGVPRYCTAVCQRISAANGIIRVHLYAYVRRKRVKNMLHHTRNTANIAFAAYSRRVIRARNSLDIDNEGKSH